MNGLEALLLGSTCSGKRQPIVRTKDSVVNAIISGLADLRHVMGDDYNHEPREAMMARYYERDYTFQIHVDGLAEKILELFPDKGMAEKSEKKSLIGDEAMDMGMSVDSGLGQGMKDAESKPKEEPALV